jgi:hypothetical protein
MSFPRPISVTQTFFNRPMPPGMPMNLGTTLMVKWKVVYIVESHTTLSSCHLMIARSFMHVNDE